MGPMYAVDCAVLSAPVPRAPSGDTKVLIQASDDAGNTALCVFTVTVSGQLARTPVRN